LQVAALKQELHKAKEEGGDLVVELQEAMTREDEALERGGGGAEGGMGSEEKELFGVLMGGFNEERRRMEARMEELRHTLKEALGDVVYLQKKVVRLERQREHV
jgi:hypothetical protein